MGNVTPIPDASGQLIRDHPDDVAHPGWHVRRGDACADDGAPQGAKLVAWFKKTHPRRVARIEREFIKELWNGALMAWRADDLTQPQSGIGDLGDDNGFHSGPRLS
jgi:hypothetical protein